MKYTKYVKCHVYFSTNMIYTTNGKKQITEDQLMKRYCKEARYCALAHRVSTPLNQIFDLIEKQIQKCQKFMNCWKIIDVCI